MGFAVAVLYNMLVDLLLIALFKHELFATLKIELLHMHKIIKLLDSR